ncbi:MAG: DUF6279 family lipoprotein [Gammaproteobacteria bacterium]|jgi:hypothetical protein
MRQPFESIDLKIPLRIALLAAAMLSLGSCALTNLAYDHAPTLVAGKFDDAFDLDSGQSLELDNRLQQYFLWHRENELSRYREVLERAALDSADGIDAAEFLRLNRGIHEAWRRALEKAIDSLGDLAVTLTPEQVAQFERYNDEQSQKYRDYLAKTPQQREIYRVDRDLARLEKWFGDFDYLLEERVRERLQQLPDLYGPWIDYREARLKALIVALRDAPQNGIDTARLKTVMLDPNTEYARAYLPARRAYWRAFAGAIEDISSWASDSQRQRVVSKLQDYARIVQELKQG